MKNLQGVFIFFVQLTFTVLKFIIPSPDYYSHIKKNSHLKNNF